MAREYEFNVDFDLSLRPRLRGMPVGELSRQIGEMAWHVAFFGDHNDAVRVSGPVPDDYLDSLHRNGLVPPELTIRPAIRSERRLSPFGWSRSAIELNRRYRAPAPHPEWRVVRRVNGRSFAVGLEQELVEGETPAAAFGCLDDLEAFLATQAEIQGGWIAKANHGNAGLGNRRLRLRELGDRNRLWIRRLFEEDDRVLVEPWRRRVLDLGVSFELYPDGGIADHVVSEVVNTAEGAFIGAIFEPAPSGLDPWLDDLERTVEVVAARLHGEEYFGPVHLDAFVWEQDGSKRLRPLVDLNARSNMSWTARRLWDSWERPAVFYWRFFTRRRLHLPETHQELEEAIGDDRFDPARHHGVLVTSPLWVVEDGRRRRLQKTGVLFVADTRHGVLAQERRFRERFDR